MSRLRGNQTAFFGLQTQPQRSSRKLFFCSGGILVLFSLSRPNVWFLLSSITQSLPDFMKPPASSLRCRRPSLAKSQVSASASPSSAEICASPLLVHRTSLHHAGLCPAMRLSSLGIWLAAFLQGIHEEAFGKKTSAQFHGICFSVSCPTELQPLPFVAN